MAEALREARSPDSLIRLAMQRDDSFVSVADSIADALLDDQDGIGSGLAPDTRKRLRMALMELVDEAMRRGDAATNLTPIAPAERETLSQDTLVTIRQALVLLRVWIAARETDVFMVGDHVRDDEDSATTLAAIGRILDNFSEEDIDWNFFVARSLLRSLELSARGVTESCGVQQPDAATLAAAGAYAYRLLAGLLLVKEVAS